MARKLARYGGNPCGPGCWPTSGGGCDCGGTVQGALGTTDAVKKGIQLGVLIALAVGGAYAGYTFGRR